MTHFLDGFRTTLFRQAQFAEFEHIAHRKMQKGEPVTKDVLNELWHELNVQYYGPDMRVDDEISYEWMRIPHFYTPYYVYQYSTGYSAAVAFSKKILEGGKPMWKPTTLGTALTGEQAVLMKRYADEVIICYDADEAGQKATARAIPILRNSGLNVKVLTIPSGKDPDEFIKSKGNDGPAAFKALLDKCGNDVEYRLQKLKNAHNIQLTEGKVAFLEEAAKLIATISSPIERDVYSSKVASELGVDKNAFKQQVSRVSRRGERAEEKKQARQIQLELSRRNDKINPEHFQKPRSSSAEEALLVYLLNNPDAYEEISARVKPEQFQNTLMRRFFEYFSARIERGEDPLTNTAADFTQDENSKLYQLMSQAIPGASTAEAMNEYINVINEESSKLNSGDLADVSNEELWLFY